MSAWHGNAMSSSEPQSPFTVDPSILMGRRPKSSARLRLRNYLLTGLIVAGPLTITIYITWWFITWVDGWVKPLVPAAYLPETYLPFPIPGFGLVIALTGLTLARLPDREPRRQDAPEPGRGGVLSRMPVVRGIYKGTKQVFETIFSANGTSFRKVGLVEFPVKGTWSLVFISTSAAPQLEEQLAGRGRICRRLPALHAEPDDRASSSICRARRDRTHDERRRCGKARHVGRRHPARRDPGAASRRSPRSPRGRPAGASRARSARAERARRLTPPAGAAPRRRARRDRAARAERLAALARQIRVAVDDQPGVVPGGGEEIRRRRRAAPAGSREARIAGCREPRLRRAGANPPRRSGSRPRSRASFRAAPARSARAAPCRGGGRSRAASPRPIRPRSWCSWARPKRSACSIDHHRRLGHVDADLDHRRRDEDLRLAAGKARPSRRPCRGRRACRGRDRPPRRRSFRRSSKRSSAAARSTVSDSPTSGQTQ